MTFPAKSTVPAETTVPSGVATPASEAGRRYELRSFPARLEDGTVPEHVLKWNQAVSLGFYGELVAPEVAAKFVACEEADGRIATGAYLPADAVPAGAWDAGYPVATYAYHRKDLNVGAGALLPLHQITAVTVRPSHRRRGLLRSLITADLAQAARDGLPMAALTASEATIYGRFGFGVATHKATVEVDTRGGLRFANPAAASAGTVEVADATVLMDLHDEVFAQVHAAVPGSVGRQRIYRSMTAGQGGYGPKEPDKKVRAALHYNAAGTVDGYVSYTPADAGVAPPTLRIVDLLAATPEAYLALWNYLGSLDLIERVTWDDAPETDPLEWALAAKRSYRRTGTEDHLWLRILNVPAALSARHFRGSGSVVVDVTDPLGLAGGTYRITAHDGAARVRQAPEGEAELTLGISELSSLYLGGVTAGTLLVAGRITELSAGSAEAFDALFATPVKPTCLTDF